MAHKKAGGSTALGRDSQPKYLGIKKYAGEKVQPGTILVRERGTKYRPGIGVRKGKDDTLYAVKNGTVRFLAKKVRLFNGKLARRTFVFVK